MRFRRSCSCQPDPNNLRWRPKEKASLVKIGVLRHDGQSVLNGIVLNDLVVCRMQRHISNVDRAWVEITDKFDQSRGQIVVKEQVHSGGIDTSLRSRSAANARQARMSSRVRSGKSARNLSSVIPEARYSRTSYTVIRNPRIQGLPPRFSGSMEMRSRYIMAKTYDNGAVLSIFSGYFAPPPSNPPSSTDRFSTIRLMYSMRSNFTGTIQKVTIDLKEIKAANAEEEQQVVRDLHARKQLAD